MIEIIKDGDQTRAIWKCPRADHDCGVVIGLARERRTFDKVWNWDGNVNAPSLTPSVNCDPVNNPALCGWHGYITRGLLTPEV